MDLNDTGNRVIAGIVVVLVIIGAWYLGTSLKPSSGKSKTADATMTDTSSNSKSGGSTSSGSTGNTDSMSGSVKVGGEAVSVSDQPAGSSVTVSSVTLPEMGWVAVRDASGRTLGAGRFDAGTQSNVQVPLLRNTEAGQTYQVLIYTDNGDKVFDLHQDTIVMNSDGSVAGASFTATKGN